MNNNEIDIEEKIIIKLPKDGIYFYYYLLYLFISIVIFIIFMTTLWALYAFLILDHKQVNLLILVPFFDQSPESYLFLSILLFSSFFLCVYVAWRFILYRQLEHFTNIITEHGITVIDKNNTITLYPWADLISVSLYYEIVLTFSQDNKIHLYSELLRTHQLNYINELSKNAFFNKMKSSTRKQLERTDYRSIIFPTDIEISKMKIKATKAVFNQVIAYFALVILVWLHLKINWFSLILFILLLLIGVYLIMVCWSYTSLKITPNSISKRNFFGKKMVLPWEEVTKVQDYTPTRREIFLTPGKVYIHSRELVIQINNWTIADNILDMQKMVAMKTPPNAIIEPKSSDIYEMHQAYHGKNLIQSLSTPSST